MTSLVATCMVLLFVLHFKYTAAHRLRGDATAVGTTAVAAHQAHLNGQLEEADEADLAKWEGMQTRSLQDRLPLYQYWKPANSILDQLWQASVPFVLLRCLQC